MLLVRTLMPIMWLPVTLQFAWVAERAIASTIGDKPVAALDYSRLVTDTAHVLISAPLGLVLLSSLPILSPRAISVRLTLVTNNVLLVCVPLSSLLLVASPLVISVIYQRGRFDALSVEVTASILTGASIGLWAQILSYVHVKSLNARGRNFQAARVVFIGAISWICTDLLLTPSLGAVALGVGISVGSIVQVLLSSYEVHQLAVVFKRLAELSPILFLPVFIAPWVGDVSLMRQAQIGACAVLAFIVWLIMIPSLRQDLYWLSGQLKRAGPQRCPDLG
jgi:putative peptidoglycan lipid II flippase